MKAELEAALEMIKKIEESLSGEVDSMKVLVAQVLATKAKNLLSSVKQKLQ